MQSNYSYTFPPNLIAQKPASPRDAAKLLVYNRSKKEIQHATFHQLPDFLPKKSLLVFNETKVIPARLLVRKETGGAVEILIVSVVGDTAHVMANRKLSTGQRLLVSKKLSFSVIGKEGILYILKPLFQIKKLRSILETFGHAPLPPYIKHPAQSEATRRTQYQTVFGNKEGSIAAPTASLHFTNRLLKKLKRYGHQYTFVTLHVGLGTFAPVTDEQLRTKRLHSEIYEISHASAKLLNQAKKDGRPIVAVGTTVVRTLESAAVYSVIMPGKKSTSLFIQERYSFKFVDAMITNFHVPESSLLMLVSAFAGREEILSVYQDAIRNNYRLFSFGDGMLIL